MKASGLLIYSRRITHAVPHTAQLSAGGISVSTALPPAKILSLPPRQQHSDASSHRGVSPERRSPSHRRQPAHSREGVRVAGTSICRGVEAATCITRSGPLVLSPLHLFCGISQWGTLPHTPRSADHQGPSANTRVTPLQGSERQVRQLPVAQET